MDPEQLQIFAALIQAMPGESAQQRLNYFQDLTKQLNVDPFGTQQPVMQEWQDPLSKYETTYAQQSEGYKSVFDAIDNGVDPLTATRGAVADARFPETEGMDDEERSRFIDDVRRVAEQYSFESIQNEQNKAEFEAKQQRIAGEAPTPLQQLLPTSSTAYEAATQRLGFEPTAENLLKEYSQFLYKTGRDRLGSQFNYPAPAPAAAPPAVEMSRGVGGGGGGGSATTSAKREPVATGRSLREILGAGLEKARQRATAPEDYGFTGRYGNIKKRMFSAAAERAGQQAKQRRVDTSSPESQQFMQNLAYAMLLQGD